MSSVLSFWAIAGMICECASVPQLVPSCQAFSVAWTYCACWLSSCGYIAPGLPRPSMLWHAMQAGMPRLASPSRNSCWPCSTSAWSATPGSAVLLAK